jgi:hypothetical protein
METLLDVFAGAVFWPLLLVGCAVALGGLRVRGAGRRQREAAERARAAHRRIADVISGPCTLIGTWRRVDDASALIEDASGAAVLVACAAPPPPLAECTRVLVVGVAGGAADDPRGVSFRGPARLVRVAVCGENHFVTDDLCRLERLSWRARCAVTVGGAGFAAGLALAMAGLLVAVRMADLWS